MHLQVFAPSRYAIIFWHRAFESLGALILSVTRPAGKALLGSAPGMGWIKVDSSALSCSTTKPFFWRGWFSRGWTCQGASQAPSSTRKLLTTRFAKEVAASPGAKSFPHDALFGGKPLRSAWSQSSPRSIRQSGRFASNGNSKSQAISETQSCSIPQSFCKL